MVVSTDSTTLTFYYDDQRSNRTGAGVHGIDEDYYGYPKWINVKYDGKGMNPGIENPYTTVKFDDSFKNARPSSCRNWFWYCTKLKSLEGIANLNTDDVTDMGYMFSNCSSLTTLDVSNFNTDDVTSMGYMFNGCSSLTTLDVSNFNTENVTDMEEMFIHCSSLTTLDVSNFNTANVTDMGGVFWGCSGITTLDVSKFNTENVTDMACMFCLCSSLTTLDVSHFKTDNVTEMSDMFLGCTSLTSLDVSKFDTKNVTNMWRMFNDCNGLLTLDISNFETENVEDMRGMFADCDNLTTIIVSNKWSVNGISDSYSFDYWYDTPFDNSPQIIGNAGTKYSDDNNNTGIAYARIDGGESNPGYLATESYKVFYDFDGDGKVDNINTVDWENDATPPTSFDLKDTPELPIPNPISKKGQKFRGWKGTPITGIEDNKPQKDISIKKGAVGNRIYTAVWDDKEAYLVVSADSTTLTFYYDDQKSNRTGAGVHGIDELDQGVFPKWINVVYDENGHNPWIENPYTTVVFDASFKAVKPTSCAWWFNYCTKLTEIKGIENLNTENVTDMGYMFHYCSSLTTLDVSKFNTANVTDMSGMFFGCISITNLDLREFDTKNVMNMAAMFDNCYDLISIDLSSKFNTENVTNMCWMFGDCISLTAIDLTNFKTDKVTDMHDMFYYCKSLTKLDLNSFNTENVTDMQQMFSSCSNLSTILVSDKWKTTNVKTSAEEFGEDWYDGPFSGLPNIIGNAGTTYSEDHQDVDYAHIDTESNPGYLTTGSYKVFYDLDGGKWADGVNPPTSFALDLKDNVKIPSPKKSGMKFVGWTGTLASGISSETPTMDVQITPDKLGNRIYTAHWVPKTYVKSGIPEKITYPDNPQDNEGFCNGTQKYFTIKFSLPDDKIATGYELAIPKIVAKADALTGVADDDMIDYEITVDIPDDKQPGAYSGTLTLSFGENTETKEYSLTLEVAAARNVIMHLYKDVIFVNNHDGIYQGNGTYQWYRNGQEIPKANYQYIHDPNMSGKYKARMLTTDGVTVYSCPIDEGEGLSKDLKLQVKTYPNPVVAGNEFTLEIEEYDPSAAYTIHISNSNGVVVKEIANATEYSSVTLPRGIYSCVLVSGGRKRGFKIIVK